MKVTHLGVILDAESVLLIPTYIKSKFIHCYYSISCWVFEYMELYKTFFGGIAAPKSPWGSPLGGGCILLLLLFILLL